MEKKEVIIKALTKEELPALPKMVTDIWLPLTPGQEAAVLNDDILNIPAEETPWGIAWQKYPKGYLVAVVDGKLAGEFRSIRLNYDIENPCCDWDEISGHVLHTTHEPDGDTVYGIALGVHPDFRGYGVGQKLAVGLQELCREENCKRVCLGARIPDYHKHTDVPVEEYIRLRREDGQLLDSELRFYARAGYHFTKVLPEYMRGENADPESLNYGVLAIWDNPDYHED